MAYYPTTTSTFNRAFTIPTSATIPWAPLAGRILLATIFILSGLTKFTDWQGTAAYMAAHGIPMISVLLPLAGVKPVTCGGEESTVTKTLAGVELPAASNATAVTVAGPLPVALAFQRNRYGAVVNNGPALTPLTLN